MLATINDLAAKFKLLRRLTICGSDTDALARLSDIAGKSTQPVIVSWLNAHGLVLAVRDRVFRNNLLKSSLIFRDGIGISVLLRLTGQKAGANMNGTDFIPRILAAHAGKPVALIGTKEPFLSRAADAFRERGIHVVAVSDGFHAIEAYVKVAANSGAALIVLAMGMPRQEEVAAFLQEKLTYPCVILNGGAILDFVAERFRRAPVVVRHMRMEWLFRLMQEPRRLWRRYILGGFLFAFYSLRIAPVFRRRMAAQSRRGGDEAGAEQSGGARKMEIVHVVRQYSPSVGGLEDAVKNLCVNLARRDGVKVRIVTLNRLFTNPSVTLPRHEVLDGIPVTRVGYVGSKRYPLAFGVLKAIASADIVHVHAVDFFYDFLALAQFLHRKKLVVSTHGGFFHTLFAARLKKIYFQTVTRFSALFYSAVCASSENDAATFRRVAAPSKVAVIENGVNVQKWRGRGSIVPLHAMIFVGRWSVNKAVPVLIDLVAALKKQGELWNLIIVGIPGEETRASLEAYARKSGVETQVQIHENPSEERIAELIGQASFIASASRYEGFGISAVEGLSAGLVPLLSPIPPFEKLRAALGLGAVIDEKDLSQSAHRATAAYNALVASPTPTREACIKFAQQYDWSGVTDRFMDVYRRVQ